MKPSSIVPVSLRVTTYEDYVLKVLSERCGIPKSTVVRVALLRLISSLMENTKMAEELPQGYNDMLKQLKSEAEEVLNKCVSKLARI